VKNDKAPKGLEAINFAGQSALVEQLTRELRENLQRIENDGVPYDAARLRNLTRRLRLLAEEITLLSHVAEAEARLRP